MENTNAKKGLFSAEQIEKIQKLKSTMQKAAVWLFVGGAVLAALSILSGSYDVMGRMMGTIFIIAFVLVFSAAEFERINSDYKAAQVFSLVGLISNVIWGLIGLAVTWGSFDLSIASPITKAFSVASTFVGLGLFGCLTMGIKEYDKRQTIMPLKITAGVCLTYTYLFSLGTTLEIISEKDSEFLSRAALLAGFAAFVWFISVIAAYIISRNIRKSQVEKANNALIEKGRSAVEEKQAAAAAPAATSAPKTEEELRAEIEEKVRREMIEKEVRERVAKEMAEKKEQ